MIQEIQDDLVKYQVDSNETLSKEDLIFLAHELGISTEGLEDMVVESLSSSVVLEEESYIRK